MKIAFIFFLGLTASASSWANSNVVGKEIVIQSELLPSWVSKPVAELPIAGARQIGHAAYFDEAVSNCRMRWDRYYDFNVITDLSIPAGTKFKITRAETYIYHNSWGFPSGETRIEMVPEIESVPGDLPKGQLEHLHQYSAEMIITCGGDAQPNNVLAKMNAGSVDKALRIMSKKFNFIIQ